MTQRFTHVWTSLSANGLAMSGAVVRGRAAGASRGLAWRGRTKWPTRPPRELTPGAKRHARKRWRFALEVESRGGRVGHLESAALTDAAEIWQRNGERNFRLHSFASIPLPN